MGLELINLVLFNTFFSILVFLYLLFIFSSHIICGGNWRLEGCGERMKSAKPAHLLFGGRRSTKEIAHNHVKCDLISKPNYACCIVKKQKRGKWKPKDTYMMIGSFWFRLHHRDINCFSFFLWACGGRGFHILSPLLNLCPWNDLSSSRFIFSMVRTIRWNIDAQCNTRHFLIWLWIHIFLLNIRCGRSFVAVIVGRVSYPSLNALIS